VTPVAGLKPGGPAPSPFEVPLSMYMMQPWNNRNVNLQQWFNYGLTPATWTTYCRTQMDLLHKSTTQTK
jgi:hypothetical protein